ncbi:MAG: hypothetical protein AAF734_02015 [Bacteroidota bacterium]
MQEKPRWLIRIQENSWEPELFISGGAIFTLLQLTEFLQVRSFISFQQSGYFEVIIIAQLVISAINALIFGFGIHLVVRGFWMGAVCLSYAFPGGIDIRERDFSPVFQQKLGQLSDSEDLVVRLEWLSSVIFFLSFFFFLVIFGFFVTLMVLIPHSGLRESIGTEGFRVLQVISYIILSLGSLYFIDFITLGYIKKQRWLAGFYYPIYWFFSLLSLSFLYRSAYYNLISNSRPWGLALAVSTYIGLALGGTVLLYGGIPSLLSPHEFLNVRSEVHQHDVRYYEDERAENELVQHVSIPSAVMAGNYIKLFVVHQKLIEKTMSMDLLGSSSTAMKQYLRRPENLRYFSEFYQVYIDEQMVSTLRWRQYEHPTTGEMGIVAYLPIEDLSVASHVLTIRLNIKDKQHLQALKRFGMEDNTYAYIPFWRE